MALVIRRISATEVNLAEYDAFAAKCKGNINVGAQNSLALSIEAANVAVKLSEYRALLSFTLSELEKDTKATYSRALLGAQKKDPAATSDPRREAVARQDTEYSVKLTETAQIKAMLEYVHDCWDHATKLHYVFKATYSVDSKTPMGGMPIQY